MPGLVFVALSGAAFVLFRFVVVPARIARVHADAATVRWVPVPPDRDHGAHRPLVEQYRACGYEVHSFGRLHLGATRPAVTLLAHPDLSVVDVVGGPGSLAASITSLLADGTSVLETMAGLTTPRAPGRLIQVLPGATPAEIVAHHRQALAWLGARGIVAAGHVHGPPGVFEAAPHLLGRVPAPTPREVDALTRGLVRVHDGPLAEQPTIEDQIRSAGLLAVGWPMAPSPPATPAPPAPTDRTATEPSPWDQAV